MNTYYKGENQRFSSISDAVGATVNLGYDVPTHSTVQAKSNHSLKNPTVPIDRLRKLKKDGEKKRITTSTVLNRTPEMDCFVLAINSWSNITSVENIYDGNFWQQYLSHLDLESVQHHQRSTAALFPNQSSSTIKHGGQAQASGKRKVTIELDSEEYDIYCSLSERSKEAFGNGKLHLRKLKKLKNLESSRISPYNFFL